jgi:MFS family permease
MSLTFTIVGDIIPPRERGRYTGYLTGTFALASVLGPLVGGFLTDHLSWRWVFYVNLPIGIVALVVTSKVLRIPFNGGSRIASTSSVLVMLVGSVTSLLLATVWASDEYGWSSPTTVTLYAAAVLAAAPRLRVVGASRRRSRCCRCGCSPDTGFSVVRRRVVRRRRGDVRRDRLPATVLPGSPGPTSDQRRACCCSR